VDMVLGAFRKAKVHKFRRPPFRVVEPGQIGVLCKAGRCMDAR
jgi:hypothetical protein